MNYFENCCKRCTTWLVGPAGFIFLLLAGTPATAQNPVPADGVSDDAVSGTVLIDDEPVVLIDPDGNPLPLLGNAELQQLVSPVALYPDDLLAIVLPASAYPLQIVMADRYLDDLENDDSLQPDEDWDESVIALLNYPEVVRMMSEDLDWTWQLGEAVITQETDVINAVSSFRELAYEAGNLETDNYQTVSRESEVITIRQIDEQVVYVPYYEPAEVIVYQPRPVYYYYPTAYPVYYYPYTSNYRFSSGFFWGVTTAFSIGWSDYHLHVYHPTYRRHPYYGRRYNSRYVYRQPDIRVFNRIYVDNSRRRPRDLYRDGSYWRPQHNSGSRPRNFTAGRYDRGAGNRQHVRRFSSDRRGDRQAAYNFGPRPGTDFADRIRSGNRNGWAAGNLGNSRADRVNRQSSRSQSDSRAERRGSRNDSTNRRLNRDGRETAGLARTSGRAATSGAPVVRDRRDRSGIDRARSQSDAVRSRITGNRPGNRVAENRAESRQRPGAAVQAANPARGNRGQNRRREAARTDSRTAPVARQGSSRRDPSRQQSTFARAIQDSRAIRDSNVTRYGVARNAPARNERSAGNRRNVDIGRAAPARVRSQPATQAGQPTRSQRAAPRSRDLQQAARAPRRSQPDQANRNVRAQRNQALRTNRAQPGNRGIRSQAREQRAQGVRGGGNRVRRAPR